MLRKREASGADAHLRERAAAGGGDSPTILRERLQEFESAGKGNHALDVFNFGAFDFAIFGVVIGVGKEFAYGGDAGAAVGLAHDIIRIESMFLRPDCPNARDRGSGVHEHAVQIKEHTAALNFHEIHDTWYSADR